MSVSFTNRGADGDALYRRTRPIIPTSISRAAMLIASTDPSPFARAFRDEMGDEWADYLAECESQHMSARTALRAERVA